ncbi:MAG: complex I NDUFA9 subunit family protein, partial [Alphaproteobacteria bacterium]
PVYVGDVADGLARFLTDPAAAGKTFEFGGPRVYRYRDIMEIVLTETNRRRLLMPVPFALAELQAVVLERLPRPPLTRDQLRLLKRDNLVGRMALRLKDLGVEPTAVEVIVPTYLGRYRRGGAAETPSSG